MSRKSIASLMAAAVAGLFAVTTANANVNINLTLVTSQPSVVSPDPDLGQTFSPFVGGTWQVYATVTGTTSTLGLAGMQINVSATGNLTVVDDQAHGDLTTVDLPSTPQKTSKTGFTAVGFELKESTGTNGIGIAGYQDNTNYINLPGTSSSMTNILLGVGLTAGNQSVDNSWSFPVEVADGFYSGTSGSLTVEADSQQADVLPATLGTPTDEGGKFTAVNVDTINNGPENGTGSASAAIGAVPEPASIGMLALGGLALLARKRRKA